MGQVIVAARYAKSLLRLAAEKGTEAAIYSDMKLVAKTCEENRDLELLLRSPIVKVDKKTTILEAIFKDKVNPLSQSFLNIITKKKRENFLPEIAIEFQNQYKRKHAIVTATVTTATGLDAEMKSAVLKLIKGSADSEVELIELTDTNLIGGMIVRIGDNQYDGSLQRRLNDLKLELGGNSYKSN